MGQADGDRNAFLTRIGTFFVLLGALLIIMFIASDVSRMDEGRKGNSTQTALAHGIQAWQTRDAGATQAKLSGGPTPTMAPLPSDPSSPLNYLPFFCGGLLAFGLGWFMRFKFSPPPAASKRFEGVRKLQQKRREAAAQKPGDKKAPPKK